MFYVSQRVKLEIDRSYIMGNPQLFENQTHFMNKVVRKNRKKFNQIIKAIKIYGMQLRQILEEKI